MPRREQWIVPLLAAALVLAAMAVPGARAEGNYFELLCQPGNGTMLVEVHLTMNEPMSTERWQGWVLKRKTLADCSETEICDVMPLPTANTTIQVEDPTVEPNVAYYYTFLLVNAHGERVVPDDLPYDGPDPIWIGWNDAASIGTALFTVGKVKDYFCPYQAYIARCADTCWADLSVADTDLCDHVGEIVAVYGDNLDYGVEGPVINLDHLEPATCPPVPMVPMSWGALKQHYH